MNVVKETLINSTDEMKREAHGTQQPRPINKIGEVRVLRNVVICSHDQLISVSLVRLRVGMNLNPDC